MAGHGRQANLSFSLLALEKEKSCHRFSELSLSLSLTHSKTLASCPIVVGKWKTVRLV